MDYTYRKYTKFAMSVKMDRIGKKLAIKAQKPSDSSKIKGFEMSVHNMDKTDMICVKTERFITFPENPIDRG